MVPQQRRRYILFSLWCIPNILPEGFSPVRLLLLPTTDPRSYHQSYSRNSHFVGVSAKSHTIAWRFLLGQSHSSSSTRRKAVHSDIIPWTPVVPQDDLDWKTTTGAPMETVSPTASSTVSSVSDAITEAVDAALEEKESDEMTAASNDVSSVASATPSASSSTTSTTRTHLPSDPELDLSGTWKLEITDAFKREYDTYLQRLGQPMFVRSIAVSLIGRTTEATRQSGKELWIQSTNPRGVWERVLVSDGSSSPLKTIDQETVQAEAWWEGTVHHSWLRGVTKYGGGSFESRRFLESGESNDDTLCCASTFHPNDPERPSATVTWRFLRTTTKE